MINLIEEDVQRRINSMFEIIDYQNIVAKITKEKGSTYKNSHAYKLGLEYGLAHLQNLKEKIEKIKREQNGSNLDCSQ
jgi:hypothetical protein